LPLSRSLSCPASVSRARQALRPHRTACQDNRYCPGWLALSSSCGAHSRRIGVGSLPVVVGLGLAGGTWHGVPSTLPIGSLLRGGTGPRAWPTHAHASPELQDHDAARYDRGVRGTPLSRRGKDLPRGRDQELYSEEVKLGTAGQQERQVRGVSALWKNLTACRISHTASAVRHARKSDENCYRVTKTGRFSVSRGDGRGAARAGVGGRAGRRG
jgi:hypothetical protein